MPKSELLNAKTFEDYINKKRKGLSLIITNLKKQKRLIDKSSTEDLHKYGESQSDNLETSGSSKLAKKRCYDRSTPVKISSPLTHVYHNNNNNNNVKNERLSPGTPDLSSRSRSITPSSASHPDTPPAPDNTTSVTNRNYSDFMRSLAAKYNNTNPNDAVRNGGFPPALDARFKPALFPSPTTSTSGKDDKKAEFPSHLLNPFANTPMFPPLIDMSSTQSLLALVRTAKEAEIQRLLNVKRQEATASPLDLSSAAAAAPSSIKKMKNPSEFNIIRTDSPLLHEDVSNWSVDDVCNFISSIDICAEYAQRFREQQIDGAGLPLLTEEHLISTMHMKLGPALKLRSILAKKLGSCSVCLHCTHCHSGSLPESPANVSAMPLSAEVAPTT